MTAPPFLILLVIFTLTRANDDNLPSPRIAIIGSGIGGTAASYYIREKFGEEAIIDVYEKEERTCGRLGFANVGGRLYNSGGCVIHPRNQHMVNFTRIAGMTKDDGDDGLMYLYDQVNKDWAMWTTGYSFIDLLLMIWKYGLSPFILGNTVDRFLASFDRIYDLQEKGEAFDTVEDMMFAMGGQEFTRTLKIPFREFLIENGCTEPMVSDLGGAAMAVNYGQYIDNMHAFVGMVSMAGFIPGLFSIKEGNGKICNILLEKANANVHLSTPIRTIKRVKANSYTIIGDNISLKYDAVVVAVPLQLSGIKLVGFDNVSETGNEGPYHRTVATFLNATGVRPEFFGGGFKFSDPPEILSTTPSETFTSVSPQDPVSDETSEPMDLNQDTTVYKVFSNDLLKKEDKTALFGDSIFEEYIADWRAYPSYAGFKERKISKLSLDGAAAAYISPIEWAASAMEMSCIGAANAANLIYRALNDRICKLDAASCKTEALS